MNGIEKISSRIEADAKAQAAEIKAEADNECSKIRQSYEAKAQEEYKRLVREGVRDAEMRAQRLQSTAEMEVKKSILTLKQEMVSHAFKRAGELIRDMGESEYVALLAKLASNASSNGLEEVVFNAKDRTAVGDKVVKAANELLKQSGKKAKLTLSELSRPISGGVIVKQGDIEVNCSIETLTELYRSELATQVADTMFN